MRRRKGESELEYEEIIPNFTLDAFPLACYVSLSARILDSFTLAISTTYDCLAVHLALAHLVCSLLVFSPMRRTEVWESRLL